MPKEKDLVKLNTIKRYIKEVQKMRISATAADELRIRINDMLKKVITEGKTSAREDDRNTIMPRDIEPAMAHIFGLKNLKPNEIMKQIRRLNAVELGELSKSLSSYIKKEKAKKN